MATWVMHLRVSQIILEMLGPDFQVDETAYYVGSVAPDSGKMIGNFTYVPSKDVSHWKREDVSYEQRFEDNAAFFYKYIENETDLKRKSFYLGYYVHILTDTIYVRDIIHPYMRKMGDDFWRENIEGIRAGWYEIDFRFMAANPSFYPLSLLKQVEDFPNTYLDYFDETDLTERVLNCVELFSNPKVNENCVFYTHDEPRAIELIKYMTETISGILKNKHNIIKSDF